MSEIQNQTRILSDGFEHSDGNIYDFIPPSPTEETRGGIIAKERTTETGEMAVDPVTGRAYAPSINENQMLDLLFESNLVESVAENDSIIYIDSNGSIYIY